MQNAYRIVDWTKLYEVSSNGKPAKDKTALDSLRKSPLPYIRFMVHGHSLGPSYRKMIKKAFALGSMMEMACFGFFAKLLELAADQEAKFRGWILDEKQRPINPEQIAELLDIREEGQARKILEILCHPEVGWVELAQFPYFPPNSPTDGGEKGKKGDASEGSFKKETETEGIGKGIGNRNHSPNSGGEKGKKGESIDSPQASCPVKDSDSESVSETDFPDSVSDLDSVPGRRPGGIEDIKRQRAKAALELSQIIKPRNNSDYTTLNDICNHLYNRMIAETDEPLFDLALDKARQCWRAQKPIAMFVAAMKKTPFFYNPRGISVIRGKLDKY